MRRLAVLIGVAVLAGCGPDEASRLSPDRKVVVRDPENEKQHVFFGMGGPHELEPVEVGSVAIVVEDGEEGGGRYRAVKVRTEEATPRVGMLRRLYLRPAR